MSITGVTVNGIHGKHKTPSLAQTAADAIRRSWWRHDHQDRSSRLSFPPVAIGGDLRERRKN
jgi:hypothetical protein